MRSKLFLLVSFSLAMIFAFSACIGDDDNGGVSGLPDDNDEEYDWEIMISDALYLPEKSDEFSITAIRWGEYDEQPSGNDYKIKIDGVIHDMFGGYGLYQTYVPLSHGTEYDIEFLQGEEVICSSTIKTPYKANIEFPDPYIPTQATTLNWTMEGNNNSQYFQAYSEIYEYAKGDEEEDEGYFLLLSPSDRSLTIHANAVEEVGPQGYYSLSLMQLNFYTESHCEISCMSVASNQDGYKEKDMSASDYIQIARELRSQR